MLEDSLTRFRSVVAAACAGLEDRRQHVNDLNVFPVADGDTGDNMFMTMRAVLAELDRVEGQWADQIDREELVQAVARAALLGARGNSGVILSQIVRGAAEELASRPGELIDPVLVAAALARAADAAYESVREPAEGTMLTAVRAMAHAVARHLAHADDHRLAPGADPAEQDARLAEVLESAVEAAEEAVRRGPEQLAALSEAGVVDAGAYGLTVMIAAVVAALRGAEAPEPAPELSIPLAGAVRHTPDHWSSAFRYCTNFAVTGEGLDSRAVAPLLEAIGDSVMVVGDERTLRVHVHTDEPDRAVALLREAGEVSRLDVADMHDQAADRTARLVAGAPASARPRCGVVAVTSGAGPARMFEELGALGVDGGTTFNPSVHELLAGIQAAGAEEVLVLPNHPDVIPVAGRAAELSEKLVRVLPTRAQQAGLAALVAFAPERSVDENAAAMTDELRGVRTGGVAGAARDDPGGRFRAGEAVGYAGEELVAWGEVSATLAATVARLADGCELVTCLAGEAAPLDRAAVASAVPEGAELDYHAGGQPAWWWLFCAE